MGLRVEQKGCIIMKIALIQTATLLGQPQKNRECLSVYLKQAVKENVDTVIFPETWNVGFFPDNIEELAEDVEASDSLNWMVESARAYHINIVGGSIAVRDNKEIFNRSYIINRRGEVVYHYDKGHLFSPGKEPLYFTAGEQNELFELDGISCAIQICYDLRFPELARKQAMDGAKILFVPAQWPHPRSNHWITLSKARAIENQFYVVTCNGCGTAGNLVSCGHSSLYNPWGEELILAGEDEGIHVTNLDLKQVEEARSKIPVFQDRRPQLYKE